VKVFDGAGAGADVAVVTVRPGRGIAPGAGLLLFMVLNYTKRVSIDFRLRIELYP
jgi:hypothetical protein